MIKVSACQSVTRFDLARTLAGRGRYWTTAYYVDGLMIDTGCAFSAGELARELAGKPLERVVNTHTHEDHIGANGLLKRQNPTLEILAHPLALPVLANPRGQYLHPYRRLMWGWPEPSRARLLEDEGWIETRNHRFQVFWRSGPGAVRKSPGRAEIGPPPFDGS